MYIEDGEKATWYFFFRGGKINDFLFTTFEGTYSEAKSKLSEVKELVWKSLYGNTPQHALSAPILTAEVYSEDNWNNFFSNRDISQNYKKLDDITGGV